jgi:uncharacterized oxidoreductase
MDRVTGSATGLRAVAATILGAAGAGRAEAVLVAEHLVGANLRGHDSHGIGMLPRYVGDMRSGRMSPNAPLRLLEDGGSFMRFSGDMGFGQRVGSDLVERLIARARTSGAVVATLRDSYHLGRIGAYAEQAIEAGLVSIHFVNVTGHPPAVAPFGGIETRFLTNPICIGFPGTATQPPFVADFATSAVALGKVRVAYNEGRELAVGLAIDAHGNPTTDAGAVVTTGGAAIGALLPFGGHKGYCLMLAAELLAGVLAGGGTGRPERQGQHTIVNSMLSVVIDPARLAGEDWLADEVNGFLAYVRSCRPADAAAPVLVPGDPERAMAARRLSRGIPVDATTWRELVATGESVGLAGTELAELAVS